MIYRKCFNIMKERGFGSLCIRIKNVAERLLENTSEQLRQTIEHNLSRLTPPYDSSIDLFNARELSRIAGLPHKKWIPYWAKVSVLSIFTHQFFISLMGGTFKIFMRLPCIVGESNPNLSHESRSVARWDKHHYFQLRDGIISEHLSV